MREIELIQIGPARFGLPSEDTLAYQELIRSARSAKLRYNVLTAAIILGVVALHVVLNSVWPH